jgi:hypothetical protein
MIDHGGSTGQRTFDFPRKRQRETLSAVETHPVSISYAASLRVEDAAPIHDELTRRLGPPDECINKTPGKLRSLWAMKSRVPAGSDINEHFAWLAELVERNNDFFRELVVSGVRVTLRLECNTNLDYALIGFDTFLFKPFVSTGIAIEFYAGLESSEDGTRRTATNVP